MKLNYFSIVTNLLDQLHSLLLSNQNSDIVSFTYFSAYLQLSFVTNSIKLDYLNPYPITKLVFSRVLQLLNEDRDWREAS